MLNNSAMFTVLVQTEAISFTSLMSSLPTYSEVITPGAFVIDEDGSFFTSTWVEVRGSFYTTRKQIKTMVYPASFSLSIDGVLVADSCTITRVDSCLSYNDRNHRDLQVVEFSGRLTMEKIDRSLLSKIPPPPEMEFVELSDIKLMKRQLGKRSRAQRIIETVKRKKNGQ